MGTSLCVLIRTILHDSTRYPGVGFRTSPSFALYASAFMVSFACTLPFSVRRRCRCRFCSFSRYRDHVGNLQWTWPFVAGQWYGSLRLPPASGVLGNQGEERSCRRRLLRRCVWTGHLQQAVLTGDAVTSCLARSIDPDQKRRQILLPAIMWKIR